MYQKRKYLVVLIFGIISFFNGCGSKNIEVKTPESQITANKEKSYIVFSRPASIFGSALDVDVMEFDIEKKEPIKLVSVISNGERIIYETNEGKHYFFTNVGQNENIETIDIKKGETKFVNISANIETGILFYPLIFDKQRLEIKKEISNVTCDNNLLKKLLFKRNLNGDSELESSALQFKIICEKNKIKEIKDLYYGSSVEDLNKVKLVQPSEEAFSYFNKNINEFSTDIKEYYPIWDFKFRNVPIVESPIMLIDNIIEDKQLNKFSSVNIISGKHNEKMDKLLITEYINDLKNEFSSYTAKDKILSLKITFDKYDNGSMASRYMLTGIGKNSLRDSMGVIDFRIELIDENNEVINSFRIFEVEAGGILGGINTLKPDTMKIITEYIQNNLLKKK